MLILLEKNFSESIWMFIIIKNVFYTPDKQKPDDDQRDTIQKSIRKRIYWLWRIPKNTNQKKAAT